MGHLYDMCGKDRVIFENCLVWNKLQERILSAFCLITAGLLNMLFLKSAAWSQKHFLPDLPYQQAYGAEVRMTKIKA